MKNFDIFTRKNCRNFVNMNSIMANAFDLNKAKQHVGPCIYVMPQFEILQISYLVLKGEYERTRSTLPQTHRKPQLLK